MYLVLTGGVSLFMLIESKYEIGQEVYLKTDTEQRKRIITGICIRPGSVQYDLTCGNSGSWHYEFEISQEVDNVIKTID